MLNIKLRLGFTLVELLLVIAVVGILATTTTVIAVIPNLQRARNADRQADLEAIRSGLELYRSQNKTYPTASGWASSISTFISGGTPVDPLSPARQYDYIPSCGTTCTTYKLCASMENNAGNAGDVSGCSCGTPCNYGLTQ